MRKPVYKHDLGKIIENRLKLFALGKPCNLLIIIRFRVFVQTLNRNSFINSAIVLKMPIYT